MTKLVCSVEHTTHSQHGIHSTLLRDHHLTSVQFAASQCYLYLSLGSSTVHVCPYFVQFQPQNVCTVTGTCLYLMKYMYVRNIQSLPVLWHHNVIGFAKWHSSSLPPILVSQQHWSVGYCTLETFSCFNIVPTLFVVVSLRFLVTSSTYPAPSHTTVLPPFFRDHSGEPVPEENFWTLWCKGRLTEADTPTIWLGATPSGLTRAHLHHPPYFLQAGYPSCRPSKNVKALKATSTFRLGRRH